MMAAIVLANFANDFDPSSYLDQYYRSARLPVSANLHSVATENAAILAFYANRVAPLLRDRANKECRLLEVGGGPTIYQFISVAPYLSSICFTDFLSRNVAAVRDWVDFPTDRWKTFVEIALRLEGLRATSVEVGERLKLIREKLKSFGLYDATTDELLEGDFDPTSFDIVASNFCLESITTERTIWKRSVRNIANRLKPGGVLTMASLKRAEAYQVGELSFPAVSIDESDVKDAVRGAGFAEMDIITENCTSSNDYHGLIFTTAVKL